MSRTAKLEAVYAQIPKIACKGKCHEACGPITMSGLEYERLGKPKFKSLTCPVLDADKRCSRYEQRPTICRLWGVVDGMSCPYGCEIEGGQLIDGGAILAQIHQISSSIKPDLVQLYTMAAEQLAVGYTASERPERFKSQPILIPAPTPADGGSRA